MIYDSALDHLFFIDADCPHDENYTEVLQHLEPWLVRTLRSDQPLKLP